MRIFTMFAKGLAMVGSQDDERIRVEVQIFYTLHQPADFMVSESDLAFVWHFGIFFPV